MQERRWDSYDWLLVQNASLQVSLFPEFCRHHQRHLGGSNIISFPQCFQQKDEINIPILKIPFKKKQKKQQFFSMIYGLICSKKMISALCDVTNGADISVEVRELHQPIGLVLPPPTETFSLREVQNNIRHGFKQKAVNRGLNILLSVVSVEFVFFFPPTDMQEAK